MFKLNKNALVLSLMIGCSVNAAELPIVGALGLGGGTDLLGGLPLIGGLLTGGEFLGNSVQLANGGFPIISDLPLIGGLPVIDGRGIPVVRDVEGAVLLINGLTSVVFSNPNLGGGLPLFAGGGIEGGIPLVGMLLTGGPTLNFLSLGTVLPF